MYNVGPATDRAENPTHDDFVLSKCIVCYIVAEVALRVTRYVSGHVPIINIIYMITIFLVGMRTFAVLCKSKSFVILAFTEIIILFYALYGYVSGASSTLLFDTVATCCLVSVPLMLSFYQLATYDYLLHILEVISPFITVLLAVTIALQHNETSYTDGSAMVLSYTLLLPMMIYIQSVIDKPNIHSIIILVVSFGALFLYGSRGPLLAIATYFCIRLLLASRSIKGLITAITCAIMLAIIYINLDNILSFISTNIMHAGQYYSRNTTFLQNGEISSVGGRDIIWKDYIEKYILVKPFVGWGMCVAETIQGINSHNTFIELAATAGIPITIIYLSIVLYGLSQILLQKSAMGSEQQLLTVLFCCCVPHYYIRGYLFTTIVIAGYIGMVLHMIHVRKIGITRTHSQNAVAQSNLF